MSVNPVAVYNRLFELINNQATTGYFSGSRFLSKVREVDRYYPDYTQYIAERRRSGKSTSRKSFFYDVLLEFDDAARVRIVNSILDDAEDCDLALATEIRSLLTGVGVGPRVEVPKITWNADRPNNILSAIL